MIETAKKRKVTSEKQVNSNQRMTRSSEGVAVSDQTRSGKHEVFYKIHTRKSKSRSALLTQKQAKPHEEGTWWAGKKLLQGNLFQVKSSKAAHEKNESFNYTVINNQERSKSKDYETPPQGQKKLSRNTDSKIKLTTKSPERTAKASQKGMAANENAVVNSSNQNQLAESLATGLQEHYKTIDKTAAGSEKDDHVYKELPVSVQVQKHLTGGNEMTIQKHDEPNKTEKYSIDSNKVTEDKPEQSSKIAKKIKIMPKRIDSKISIPTTLKPKDQTKTNNMNDAHVLIERRVLPPQRTSFPLERRARRSTTHAGSNINQMRTIKSVSLPNERLANSIKANTKELVTPTFDGPQNIDTDLQKGKTNYFFHL